MKILVFGDSHSIYFNKTNELESINEKIKGITIDVNAINGATILGFGKRESTLNSNKKFTQEYIKTKPDFVLFALGQVDIELGLYYRKIIKRETIETTGYIEKLIQEYIKTIQEIQSKHNINNERICIKGINISTLTRSREKALRYTSGIISENYQDANEIKIHRQNLNQNFPSVLERYSIHKTFNENLKKRAFGSYKYFDINDVLEDKLNTGHCHNYFLPAKHDHHLVDSLFIRELHIERLIETIFLR